MRLPYRTIKVHWILLDLHVQLIIKTAAEKLSLMTYASHAWVITGIILESELDTLVNQDDHAAPIRSPVRGRTGFSKSRGLRASVPFFPLPHPLPSTFLPRPTFHASRMRKTNTRCPNFVRFVRERLLGFSHKEKRSRLVCHLIWNVSLTWYVVDTNTY